mgnify:CR=1 FL=1
MGKKLPAPNQNGSTKLVVEYLVVSLQFLPLCIAKQIHKMTTLFNQDNFEYYSFNLLCLI